MFEVKTCPLCQEANFTHFLHCTDHTVSHEQFELRQCQHCGFVVTSPRPDDAALSRYYQSDAYISHTNKSKGVIDQVYKVSRHFTLKWKYNIISKYLSNDSPGSILDLGCGTGNFLAVCDSHHLTTSGVEPSNAARSEAGRVTRATLYPDIQSVNGQFDILTAWHVLEHVPDLHDTISHMKRLLKLNGRIVIAVPNFESPDARAYKEKWAGYDVPRHLWHFSRSAMERLLRKHNLTLEEIIPMKLDAFYVSMLSEKYAQGKLSPLTILRGLNQGRQSNQTARKDNNFSSLIYIAHK